MCSCIKMQDTFLKITHLFERSMWRDGAKAARCNTMVNYGRPAILHRKNKKSSCFLIKE